VDLTSTSSTYVRDFVIAGVNAPSGSATGSKTFNAPDNLASAVGGSKASFICKVSFSLLTMHATLLFVAVALALRATSIKVTVAWHYYVLPWDDMYLVIFFFSCTCQNCIIFCVIIVASRSSPRCTDLGCPSYMLMLSNHAKQLYIVEDQDGRSDIWEASLATNAAGYSTSVKLFATNTASGSEATGIYFKPQTPATLYVNVQHPTSTNDLTMAISKI
jgi:hypothetical protein